MALVYGCAWRLTAENGCFWTGQVDVAGDAAAGNRGADGDADGAGAPQVVFTSSSFDHAGATATPPRSDPFPEVMHGTTLPASATTHFFERSYCHRARPFLVL